MEGKIKLYESQMNQLKNEKFQVSTYKRRVQVGYSLRHETRKSMIF